MRVASLFSVLVAALIACSGAYEPLPPPDGGAPSRDSGVDSADAASADAASADVAPGDAGAISFVQSGSVDLGAVMSGKLGFKSRIVAGHMLVVAIKFLEPATVVRVSDDAGTVWKVANPATSNGTQKLQTFYGTAARDGDSISIALSTTSNARLLAFEYAGVRELDQHSEASGAASNGPASSGSIRTTRGNVLLFSFSDEGACGQEGPPGFVLRESPGPVPGCNVGSDRVVSEPGTYSADPSLSKRPDDWITVLSSFY